MQGTQGGVIVRELTADRAAEWDAFVAQCGTATFFHRAGWQRVIAESFGHRTYYLFAEQDGVIRGVLPLVHIASRLFGNALVSTPFCVYGGPATLDETARTALDRAAIALMSRLEVDCLEYRQLARTHRDWPCKDDLYATFRRAIDPDPAANLTAIPRKQRAVIRQSLARPFTVTEDAELDDFFALYAVSVRNLGTPVFAKSYFRNLKATFGKDCEIRIVRHAGEPVCGVMSFYFRDEVLPYYAGARPAARDLGAYDFMYWHLLRDGALRGLKIFDFGRSKRGTGPFSFKRNWGFEPRAVAHHYRLIRSRGLPNVNPTNPKYRTMIEAWRRLPLPVANAISPLFSRSLA